MSGELIADRPPVRIKACKHGAMMYFTTDQYIGRSLDLYGEYSEGEVAFFAQIIQPGMTVLDVGANIGVFTLYFANAVGPTGRVYSFEPQRSLYHMLCGSLALNGLTNVTAVHSALGARPGTIFVPAVNYAKGGNFGGVSLDARDGQAPGETVPVSTLDAVGLARCDFIKIDVEGMERDVLEGATETLAKFQPVLYVENDRQPKSAALIAWLLDHGYRLYWHLPPLFNPKNYFNEPNNLLPPIISINMLGVPRSANIKARMHEIVSPRDDWQTALKLQTELANCDKTLSLNADDLAALNSRGLVLQQQHQLDEALASFDKALTINPEFVEGAYNRANALLALNRHEDALAGYDRTLALRPDYVEALNNRGWLLQQQKRYDEALASYDKALAIKPDFGVAVANRAQLLQAKKQPASAADHQGKPSDRRAR
jgi:FkbM family methyltransferase